MAFPGRHVAQFTAVPFAVIGFCGVVFSISLSNHGWAALVAGLVCGAMFLISFVTLVRNHRAGRTL
jgi:uncharacterized membrane protein